MEIMKSQSLRLSGQSTMKAWTPGVLGYLMELGLSLPEAIALAEQEQKRQHLSVVKNLIVTAGYGLVGDLLIDSDDGGLAYHEIGTSDTAPTAGDTALGAVHERKAFATRSRSGSDIALSAFYTSGEATAALEEAGVFGGDVATLTEGTGTLFSHYLQPYDNSGGTVDLTYEYELAIN